MNTHLIPDPGSLPVLPAPQKGESISLHLEGVPPSKDPHASIRNPKHRDFPLFMKLRQEAIRIMNGRRWYDGQIGLSFTLFVPSEGTTVGKLNEYLRGIMDTLDGSHGLIFTYLPIVYQDDSQIERVSSFCKNSESCSYDVRIDFL